MSYIETINGENQLSEYTVLPSKVISQIHFKQDYTDS
jgi:hypothetical protein